MLDLGFNDIGDEGATALGNTLATNQTLGTLYLSANKIGPNGAAALACGLRRNSSLMVIFETA